MRFVHRKIPINYTIERYYIKTLSVNHLFIIEIRTSIEATPVNGSVMP